MVTIKLGGVEYSVPEADLGQVEELMALWANKVEGPAIFTQSLDAATILFRGAEPAIPDVRRLRCTGAEFREGVKRIMVASGLREETRGEDQAEAAA